MNGAAANNSAMDGFAFHSDALKNITSEVKLRIIGKQFAGDALKDFSQFIPSIPSNSNYYRRSFASAM
jgi:molybdopterin molybdotransferase